MIENALLVGQLAACYMVILLPGLMVSIGFARWEEKQQMKGKGLF